MVTAQRTKFVSAPSFLVGLPGMTGRRSRLGGDGDLTKGEKSVPEQGASRRAPTAIAFATRYALAALQRRSIETQPLLDRAGLSQHFFSDPQARFPVADKARFLELAAQALEDAAFGLHLAEAGDPRDGGLLFYTLTH
jgi:hypothetical protein